MSDADLTAAAIQLVKRTTAEQGLPERVTDPSTIRAVAAIVRADRGR